MKKFVFSLQKVLELREYAMDSIELLTGNRVNMGWNVVGGVRMDADERHFKPILENLDKIEENFERVRALFAEGPALALRCKGIGVMSKKEAIKEGIFALINSLKNLNIPNDQILDQLIQNFSLTMEEAKSYLNETN